MTGRQKIEAALSPDGTPEIPVVMCYEGIYIRDHWRELTAYPWWYQQSPDIERQVQWRRDVIARTGQDWFYLPRCTTRKQRDVLRIDDRADGVYQVGTLTGKEKRLEEPQIGGWSPEGELASVHPPELVETHEEIDQRIPLPSPDDIQSLTTDGRGDLADELLKECGAELYPICHVPSPLWLCYSLWGFEGMMDMVASRPDLVEYACERYLYSSLHHVRVAAAFGAAGIWIEECLTDMVSPAAFERLNVPYVRHLVEAIRESGMHSIYYYCGDPAGKWQHLLSVGADALSLEEGKKGFSIDIQDVVAKVGRKCAVLGNLDAVGVLQDGSEGELRAAIEYQIAAGRNNDNRFVISLGSPVTPGTSVDRVRLYCEMARELGMRSGNHKVKRGFEL